jgi:hypothetical protein
MLDVLLLERRDPETGKRDPKTRANIPLDISRHNDYRLGMANVSSPNRVPQHGPRVRAFAFPPQTAEPVVRDPEALPNPYRISRTHYVTVSILRGTAENGLACREVTCCLISRDPDVSCLHDRLESRGFNLRMRNAHDHRLVTTRNTTERVRVLAGRHQPTHELHNRQLRHLPAKQLGGCWNYSAAREGVWKTRTDRIEFL